MKIPPNNSSAARIAAGLGLTLCVIVGCKPEPAPAPPKPPAAAKLAPTPAAANNTGNTHLSVFEDLAPPAGRDPFFPDSRRREPVAPPVVMSGHKASVAGDLLLKGIVGSAAHRLAVINNEILEVGEEARVRVPSGQVRVKCMEIGDDYVVIKVDGESRTQRLVMEKKTY